MDTDIYMLRAFYCGFCSTRHQPLDQADVPHYLARRVQMKPRVECTIHGDICGFVVTTAKARAFPASVINGYIALNNTTHTVAVRHCETDHFLAGYRFFSFNNTQDQDYFIQYLDTLLDSHVSMFKRNSSHHREFPMHGVLGRQNSIKSSQSLGPPVPPKTRNVIRVSNSNRLYNNNNRINSGGSVPNLSNQTDKVDPHAIDKLRRIAHMRDLYRNEYM
ncbi:unnamed protein product [Rodentolepis nana]|uniref:SH2 domain-containing protein n=1 Tax=Rodentolepis nana TaxID=102285 RepID=A0A0R3T0Y9_RODNA|nr:unnamed protein product [Rodentolepis nana]